MSTLEANLSAIAAVIAERQVELGDTTTLRLVFDPKEPNFPWVAQLGGENHESHNIAELDDPRFAVVGAVSSLAVVLLHQAELLKKLAKDLLESCDGATVDLGYLLPPPRSSTPDSPLARMLRHASALTKHKAVQSELTLTFFPNSRDDRPASHWRASIGDTIAEAASPLDAINLLVRKLTSEAFARSDAMASLAATAARLPTGEEAA